MLIKLKYPLISPTDKLILIVSFHIRQETIKKNLLAVKLFTTISVLSKSGPDPLKICKHLILANH